MANCRKIKFLNKQAIKHSTTCRHNHSSLFQSWFAQNAPTHAYTAIVRDPYKDVSTNIKATSTAECALCALTERCSMWHCITKLSAYTRYTHYIQFTTLTRRLWASAEREQQIHLPKRRHCCLRYYTIGRFLKQILYKSLNHKLNTTAPTCMRNRNDREKAWPWTSMNNDHRQVFHASTSILVVDAQHSFQCPTVKGYGAYQQWKKKRHCGVKCCQKFHIFPFCCPCFLPSPRLGSTKKNSETTYQ